MKIEVPTLFADQAASVDALRHGIKLKIPGQVLSSATGSGKTVIAQYMIASSFQKGRRSLFTVDSTPLMQQTSERFYEVGLEHGYIGEGIYRGRNRRIILAMVQTLIKWPLEDLIAFLKQFDIIFNDEAHTIYRKLAEALHECGRYHVGLTATPLARGMGNIYGRCVQVTTTNELLARGRLAPVIFREGRRIEMGDPPAGEWEAEEVRERGRVIIGDIISTWVEETNSHFGGPVKTMLFSADIAHGEELANAFLRAGIDARQITAHDNPDYRTQTMRAFRHGEFPVVISVAALGKGIDIPDVKCLILARPLYRGFMTHLQMLGRGMRTAEGKEFVLAIDHCVERNQRVLTHRGLVAICRVRDDDLLWDGVEWVSHGGAVRVGMKEVMTYAGLTATGDHKVWTQRGWQTLREASQAFQVIAETGLKGTPVRLSANRFRGGRAPWWSRCAYPARSMRMRNLRLSLDHFAAQLTDWAHRWMSRLQSASTRISSMAMETVLRRKGQVYQSEKFPIPQLWPTRHQVPIREPEGNGTLGRREPRDSGQLRIYGSRPRREQRPLRTGQSPVGVQGDQREQQEEKRSQDTHAPLQTGASGNSLCGQYPLQADLAGIDGRRNHREMEYSVAQTEREVWDIRDAGPRNRFTCEGLLTHNSGNVEGFRFETEAFWETGTTKLDDRRFLKVTRRRKVKDPPKCVGCGFALPPGEPSCLVCGTDRPRRESEIETVPGTMITVDTSGEKRIRIEPVQKGRAWIGTEAQLWVACCTHAAKFLARHGDEFRAVRTARATYNELTGEYPDNSLRFVPGKRVPAVVRRRIDQNYRRFKKQQQAQRAMQ